MLLWPLLNSHSTSLNRLLQCCIHTLNCCVSVHIVCVCVCAFVSYRYGHFSGINRKVQLTYLRNGQPKASSEEEGTNAIMKGKNWTIGNVFQTGYAGQIWLSDGWDNRSWVFYNLDQNAVLGFIGAAFSCDGAAALFFLFLNRVQEGWSSSAAGVEVGRGADACRPSPGRGAGEGVSLHVPWRSRY